GDCSSPYTAVCAGRSEGGCIPSRTGGGESHAGDSAEDDDAPGRMGRVEISRRQQTDRTRGQVMKGHIRERSAGHWAIVIDVRDPQTGKRRRKWHSFAGTKRQAQVKCAELVAAAGKGDYIEPSKATVADFVRARIDQWETAGGITARTAERQRQLLKHQIAPHLGAKVLRKLRPLDIEQWHTALRATVSARTIGHAHRLLSKALRDAIRNDLCSRNVCKEQAAPKLEGTEQAIVRDIPALVAALPGWRYGAVALVALFGGLRLGEVLALRWTNVDLDHKVLCVVETLEQTK